MPRTLFLQNEQTGAPLSADAVASNFVLNNNGNHNDARVRQITATVPRNLDFNSKMLRLFDQYRTFHESNDQEGAKATMDAMAFQLVRRDAKAALEAGEAEMPLPNEPALRAMQIARALAATRAREQATEARTERQNQETARVAALSPTEAALEELVLPAHRARVRRLLDDDITPQAMRSRLQNAQSGLGLINESWDNATALEVFNRAQEIAASRRNAATEVSPEASAPAAASASTNNERARRARELVLGGLTQAERDEVVALMRSVEGTTRQKMISLSQRLHDLPDTEENEAQRTITSRAIGVLTLKNRMDTENRTNFQISNIEAYLDYAVANADDLREARGGAGSGAGAGNTTDAPAASGERAPTYAYRGRPAPEGNEVPVIATSQVEALQQMLIDAGCDVGPKGADGLYGPDTRDALKAFCARMQPPIPELSSIDCTNDDCPEYNRLLTALDAAKTARSGASASTDEPAASASATAPAAAPTVELTEPQRNAARAALAANTQDQNDNNYGSINRAGVGTLLRFAGVTLTPEQLSRITVSNGLIQGPDILRLEQALNAVRGDAPAMQEDGKWDARLTKIAQAEGMRAFIGAVFNATAVASTDAPAPTPGGTGGTETAR